MAQVKLAEEQGNVPKQREFLWRTAEARDRLGDLDKAVEALRQLTETHLESEAQLVEALCFLADLQVSQAALIMLSHAFLNIRSC